MTKPNWFSLSDDQRDELIESTPSNSWRLVPSSDLPRVFPSDFRSKIDSALVVSAPTSSGGTYLAYSGNRVDFKAKRIDIEPFGVIVHSTGPSSSGVFLHHGSWEGRTEPPPAGFWEAVEESGVGNYFHSNPPAGLRRGTLEQLPKGHKGAFEAVLREIRARIDGKK